MRHFVSVLLLLFTALHAELSPWTLTPPKAEPMKISVLDAKEVRFPERNGVPFTELSDLAYDAKTGRLYGVSDQGFLYTMRLRVERGKIAGLKLLDAVRLRDAKGRPLCGDDADAEGLALMPGGLLVSFERRPRIALFDRRGRMREKLKLPKPLRKKKRYRGKNKMLEAAAWSPRYGVITAPELPLKKTGKKTHTIYAGKHRWRIPASGSVTAMALTRKGRLLILERDFNRLTRRRKSVLTLLDPETGRSRTVAEMDSAGGWGLDNFEGLTRLSGDRFLMISDDNDSPFQHTVLVLFELTE